MVKEKQTHLSLSQRNHDRTSTFLNVPKSHLVSETEFDFIYKENVNEIHRDSADRTETEKKQPSYLSTARTTVCEGVQKDKRQQIRRS